MKICLLADGESIHTIRWCRHFLDAGYEIHLITFKNVRIGDIHVHFIDSGNINVGGGNWKTILKFRVIRKLIREIRPDVLHALYATSYGLPGALSGFHPYIVTPLGSDILISPKESAIYRALLKYTFRKADSVTSMAPHMKEEMLKLGVPAEKITDIILGINTQIFNPEKRKLPEDRFVICSTRNFEPVYNIPHFLKAVALIKNKIPGLEVIMAGTGSLKEELVELTRELKIDDILLFTGRMPQDMVREVLNTSHVFVSVSLSDGNSLSLIEAMACGAYPVVTDIPANREWIRENVNGSFVKINDVEGLADRLLSLYENYPVCIEKALPESARIIADKGSWNSNMLKMDKLYKDVIAKKK